MNFYEFYRLLNEYGQTLVQSLIEKYTKENPGLTSTIIRSYIDRFERIKNNLPEKDITKYSWKDLEAAVDGYEGGKRIKAGKLDPTATDANLLLNKDGIRIYLGKDKKSCIKYSNGYSFCIGARGEDNMYGSYRIQNKGTPYFIFNDNLPHDNPNHILVLFVYDITDKNKGWRSRYTITNALNRGDKNYQKLENIIKEYPWMINITNFVDDKDKGMVEASALEQIEHILEKEWNLLSEGWFKGAADAAYDPDGKEKHNLGLGHVEWGLEQLFLSGSIQDLQNFLNNKNNIAIVSMYYPGYGYFESKRDGFLTYYKNSNDILNKIKKIAKETLEEDFIYQESDEEIRTKIENALRYKYPNPADELNDSKGNGNIINYEDGEASVIGIKGKSDYYEYFLVKITSPREFFLEFIEKNQIKKLSEYRLEYKKAFNWIKNQSEEKLKELLEEYNVKWKSTGRHEKIIDFIRDYLKN